ncbi:RICIN domain-containing protein [Streptomyces sp. NRRL S-920]|uniref:RICIN domain-containing protein n=1 Tax=Streptomyces sp. NRRL S-920 TaxID=1463921 RepID=UPI0009984DCB
MTFTGRTAAVTAAAGALMLLTPSISHADSTSFVNWGSRKCLEIENSSSRNGARAQQWDCNGQDGAAWEWEWVGPGRQYWIRNAHNGKCLEVADSRRDNGAPVQLWDCSKTAKGQLWLKPPAGSWEISNYGSGKALEVENSSTRNGARVQQWTWTGADGQKWY